MILSAYRERDEPRRLVRLAQLANHIATQDPDIFKHIRRLHDHKGQLSVQIEGEVNDWYEQPAIKAAWAAFNEPCWIIYNDQARPVAWSAYDIPPDTPPWTWASP